MGRPPNPNSKKQFTCEVCSSTVVDYPSNRSRFCGTACQAIGATAPVAERFWKFVDKTNANGCWPWTGCIGSRKKYGRFGTHGRTENAHRMAWELTHGPILDGLHCLHRCDNPPCCNPSHLFLGTNADNIRDCLAKGRRTRVTQ